MDRVSTAASGGCARRAFSPNPARIHGRSALLAKDSLSGLTVAFDLDGTLVDTAPDLIGVLNLLLDREGLAPVPLSAARHLVGGGARAMLEHGFAEAGQVLSPDHANVLFARYIDLYSEHICDHSAPFAGVVGVLDELAHAGAILCVCTNKLTGLSNLLLDKLGLLTRFAAVVGPDAAPERKPAAAHLWAAVDLAGGDRAKVIYVGDSLTDARTAQAARVPSIGVSFGYSDMPAGELGFDVVIDSYKDFVGALQRLRATATA